MDLNLIKRLVKIVDSSGVTDLEIEEDGTKIKIAKKIRNAQVVSQVQIPEPVTQQIVPPKQVQTESEIKAEQPKEEEKLPRAVTPHLVITSVKLKLYE